jgi:hypothetical protein
MVKVLPSGFEPESEPREGFMIGRTTLREQSKEVIHLMQPLKPINLRLLLIFHQ